MNEAPTCLPDLVPVFPLPEVVLFPRQVLPLHIFEPRYRDMVADALAGEELIAIALLKPNYEQRYFTSRAPIHRLVGIGRIIAAKRSRGGNYDILLHGQARVLLREELPGHPYRFSRIETVEPRCSGTVTTRARLRHQLCQTVQRSALIEDILGEQCLDLFEASLTLGELTDVIAGVLPVDGEVRQSLLAKLDVCARARMLLDEIHVLETVTCQARAVMQPTAWKLN